MCKLYKNFFYITSNMRIYYRKATNVFCLFVLYSIMLKIEIKRYKHFLQFSDAVDWVFASWDCVR